MSRPASADERDRVAAEIRAAPPGVRVPDFFIVGHAKSGTTALYQMLKAHPQIFLPREKEPRYFASDLASRFKQRPSGERLRTYDDYLALFDRAGSNQRAGDASPAYILSHTAAALIAAAQPAARIIAILREPASYVRSIHLQLLQVGVETEKSLRKALALEDARRQGRKLPARGSSQLPPGLLYTDRVRYVEQLRRYHEQFSAEQVLVLIYDDYVSDNEATVRQVQRFLGVDDTQPIAVREANPTVRLRSPRLRAAALGRGPLERRVRSLARTLAPRALSLESTVAIRDRILFAKPQPPDESLMLELRRRFKPEVVALSEYLGRDLATLWGYDTFD
jgi:Sulfotransferase family